MDHSGADRRLHRQHAGQSPRDGWFTDIILGIVGAVVGGLIAHVLGIRGITGFNVWSLLIATGGAVVCLVIYHAITGTRTRQTPPV